MNGHDLESVDDQPLRTGLRSRTVVAALVLAGALLWRAPLAWAVAVPAALVLLVDLGLFVFDRWMFGGRRFNHAPVQDPATGRWTFRNWGGNQTFTPRDVVRPATLEELLAAVERFGREGRKIKPVGAVHSWSACAVAEDVCIPMAGLSRVLGHDAAAKTITVEAGIQLRALYKELDKRGLAIASIPNVDTIQLGGAIANATHGTNFSRGTMSSYVRELQIVLFRAEPGSPQQGKAELVTLREGAWFDAAVASFGSLGIIYSVTLQCEEAYACFVTEHSLPFAEIDGHIAELAAKHYSAFISVSTLNGICRTRIQVPMPRDLVDARVTCLLTEGDLRMVKLLLWTTSPGARGWLRTRKLLHRLFYGAMTGRAGSLEAQRRRRREGLMSWRDAELLTRIFAVTASAPWINLEYAVPAHRADEAARGLLALMQGHRVLSNFVLRPVGADKTGFLSPTRDRPTVYFDIGYHQALLATGIYDEMEKLLLACEGRCSWSRLFKAPAAEVIKQYPHYPEFLRAKREMDPCNIFANPFSDALLGGQDIPHST